MNVSRNKIIGYLQTHPVITVDEFSVELATTTLANIRYHLKNLLSEGMIIVSGSLPSLRRGRPVLQYSLNPAYQKNNLDILCSVALSFLFADRPQGEIQAILFNFSERIIPPPQSLSGALTQRLSRVVAALNRRHYAARWEARPDGARILFGHCPYAAIIQQHPELCQMDNHILSLSSGKDVNQIARIGEGRPANLNCVFMVNK